MMNTRPYLTASTDDQLAQEIADLKRRMRQLEAQERPRYATAFFTPTFAGTITAGTYTYYSQMGQYQRIGDWCAFSLYLEIATITTPPTGELRITGLPFVSPYFAALAVGYVSNLNLSTGCIQLAAYTQMNTNAVRIVEVFDAAPVGAYPAANLTPAGLLVAGAYALA